MSGDDPLYVQQNRHIAQRVLVFLQDRRVLRDRSANEGLEECRKSAHELRGVFENELLAVRGSGSLNQALRDLQKACTTFVSSAGKSSAAFEDDRALFIHQLTVLREIFGQRVSLIVENFDLQATPEINEIIGFASQP